MPAFRGLLGLLLQQQAVLVGHRRLRDQALRGALGRVLPSPATQRPCFDGSEGGRKRVLDALLPKTVFRALRGAQTRFHALFWRQNTV